jgi:hypothetical protein
VDGRGETRQHKRIQEEYRAKHRSRLYKHVAGVGSERSLQHSAADCAAESALFRLLEHHDKNKQQARYYFDHI